MATDSVSPLTSLGQDQFLQLLVAQLQNQDPLDPVSNQELITQLATLNTSQGIQSLNASFAEMLKLQQLTEGASLVGKTIEYTPAGGGANTTGAVDSVSVQNGQFVLQVGATQVGLDQIVSLR